MDARATVQEMKAQRKHSLDKADAILSGAATARRELSDAEQRDVDTCLMAIDALDKRIEERSRHSTIRNLPMGAFLGNPDQGGRAFQKKEERKVLSGEYADAFFEYVQSVGDKKSAALYEGSDAGGGYAVPVTVSDQIVPLAPNEMAVRRVAQVIPTAMDIKIPQKGSFGTASAKAENAAFAEVDPTLSQITLSAFMAGIQETISWELAQDVPAFQAFCVDDMILAQQMYEENLYINGTGVGQAEGLIGNVGAGVTEEPDANGNLVSIDGTLEILGKLNAVYHTNASWLMSRATSIIIRKAQRQANLFEPVWTRSGGKDYLHGYPVEYSASMPTAARGATPVLFGDFKMGYTIGDRGGSGINVKVLDQVKALNGQIVLLAYRRTDGRVRRSEAIQAYNIAAS